MKKTFRLEGLDCANCASKIETAISKLDGITSVTVNFLTTKLIIEAEDDKIEGIVESVTSIIKKLEPDVVIKKA